MSSLEHRTVSHHRSVGNQCDEITGSEKNVEGPRTIPQCNTNTMVKDSEQSPVEGDHCPKYFKGDKIYAEDSGSTYQAIIRCSAFRSSEEKTYWEYHVHFQGWSLRHDRWLQEDSIRPDSDEEARKLADMSKQRALEQRERKVKMAQIEKGRKDRKHVKVKGDRLHLASPAPGKKRKQSVHEPYAKILTMEQYCTLPFTLQRILIDDRRTVTRIGWHVTQGYDPVLCEDWTPPRFVHKIPVTISVKRILEAFVEMKLKQSKDDITVADNEETTRDKYQKFSTDMASLFDVMLPKYLLFTQERAQYLSFLAPQVEQETGPGSQQIIKNRTSHCRMSKVYGGEFLLRMLTRLPLVFSSIESVSSDLLTEKYDNSRKHTHALLKQWIIPYQKHNQSLGRHIAELIIYLQNNVKNLFKGTYRNPSLQEWTDNERAFAKKCATPVMS